MLKYMPVLMSLGIGLSINNLGAVLEALANRSTEFTRTPKYRIEGGGGEWVRKKYQAPRNFSVVGEVTLALYFLGAITFAVSEGYWLSLPFLFVFFNGFAYTAALSLASAWQSRPRDALVPSPIAEREA
jgi:hypothetical protein